MKFDRQEQFAGPVLNDPVSFAAARQGRRSDAPKVALIHYWLVGMRGGEKVLEALCRMYPQADIFTHVYCPDRVSDLIRSHRVFTTPVNRMPLASKMYQKYLPFMPAALETLDLTAYDLVISSEAGPAKGVLTGPETLHLCYCHSPMRYVWDQYHVYRDQAGRLTRAMMPAMARKLRAWDVETASRPDVILGNSRHVQARIQKYWRRDADVVHPPVAVEDFAPVAPEDRGGFYLWAGELAPYKRPDLAIEAFNRLGKPLYVIGGPGAAEKRLARQAKDNIRFLGRVDDEMLRRYIASCRALIFPGEEDFGITPVEAMASGRPVIAYGRGGALDTVIEGETGLLFEEQTTESLVDAIERFEASGVEDVPTEKLTQHAAKFSEANFTRGVANALNGAGFRSDAGQLVVAAE